MVMGLLLDNTLQGRWREASIFDHFDHFPHEYIGVLFCFFFAKKVGKNNFLLQKEGPKSGPIQMDSYSQISIFEGFFSVPWFDFWKIVEADLTLSETLVPFAEITFFPDTIFDFYRGGSDPFRDACTLRKNHLFSARTHGRTNIWIPRLPDGNKRFAQ